MRAVEAAPEVRPGPGHVVLMTISHENRHILRLTFHGSGQTLEPTAVHPLFSLDRELWVKAFELRLGERLRALDGFVTIAGIEWRAPAQVFNFEIEKTHAYLVGEVGVWSHNGGPGACPDAPRFISGARVVDRRTGTVLEGTVDLKPTLDRIASGGRFPHRNDGSIFQNRPLAGKTTPELPVRPTGYYREYVHPTPGISGPGPQRVVVGQRGEMYYTPDHYDSFVPLK